MELLQIFFSSLGAIGVLFVLTKFMGEKQLSEFSMFDYINGITIGSIAAEMATALENDFLKPLVAMAVFAGVSVLISVITLKSQKMRKHVIGKSLLLLDNGVLYKQNFAKAKIDLNEFLVQCRISGYFNLSDLQTAVLETNGKISFLPVSTGRPVTPRDLQLSPEQELLVENVIIDGEILEEVLKRLQKNAEWLKSRLKEQNIPNYKSVFLATLDNKGNVSAYLKREETPGENIFE